jgi:hypothetical protein
VQHEHDVEFGSHDKSFDLAEGPAHMEEMDVPEFGYEAPMDHEDVANEPLEDLNLDIELAAVNDLQANIDDTMEEEHVNFSTAQHKWHPHTVKVMKVLRKSLDEKVGANSF